MKIFFLPETFCGLEYAENVFVAGALAQIPLEELMTVPQSP